MQIDRIIYLIINNFGLPFYIGKDKFNNPEYFGSSKYLNAEIKYYGKQNFQKIILERANSDEEMDYAEIFYIAFFRHYDDIDLYNIAAGGNMGDMLSMHPKLKEIKKKLSIARKRNWQDKKYRNNIIKKNTGRKRSIETRNKQSIALTGRIFSKQHLKRLSQIRIDIAPWNKGRIFRKIINKKCANKNCKNIFTFNLHHTKYCSISCSNKTRYKNEKTI